MAGAGQPESLTITQFVQEMGGNGRCTVIGMGLRTSPVNAALANGAMVHLRGYWSHGERQVRIIRERLHDLRTNNPEGEALAAVA